ncbi:MAG: aspartyl-tRNA amidotransferase [Deltaproteobacteria bacterium HGW-Deltaproteobacteria-14]|jgi:hypothetical protein|nr:MAG: aspartyl-tRNA amidotransferase [Deltaproteobacteria bacterium HGW-Deltaproteobacteria-14]
MALEVTLKNDLKTAMKARDALRVGTIKLLIADLQNRLIEKQAPLSEEEELALLSRQAKQRREAIEAYTVGGREDRAASEAAELLVIEEYLPKQLTPAEVEAIVAEIIAATGATSRKDMGKIMGQLMPRVKGRFPGKDVKALVEKVLPA